MLNTLKGMFSSQQNQISNVTAAELADKQEEISVIDVRTPGEFQSGHVPGAVNIDVMGSGFDTKVSRLPKDKTHYVICQSGGRSLRACQIMAGMGFEDVVNVRGGMMAWPGDVE